MALKKWARDALLAVFLGLPLTVVLGFFSLFLVFSGLDGIQAPEASRNVPVGSVLVMSGLAAAATVLGFWVWLFRRDRTDVSVVPGSPTAS